MPQGSSFWTDLPRPFFVLAPMEGVTDIVFRHVVLKAGRPDVFFTEFTNATGFCSPEGHDNTVRFLAHSEDEMPLVAQLWGTEPEHFTQTARELKKMGFAGIDINMGCPVKNVIQKGACSALIENPSLAQEIIAATKEGGLPVSVKTRVGFKTQKTEEWISFLLRQGLVALTVHARTAKEMSKVPARWEEIKKAVQIRNAIAPTTLLIGNGDIANREDGLKHAEETGVDGVMIGRGIFHDPFCFEKTPQEHTFKEHIELLRYHLDLFDAMSSMRTFEPLKRFFKIYVRSFPGASELREQLMHTRNTDEARVVLELSNY